jgi:hypothetical protein
VTLQQIRKRVAEVLAVTSDTEVAHRRDDALRRDFIGWLADGAVLPNGQIADPSYISECAEAITLTNGIDRWFA